MPESGQGKVEEDLKSRDIPRKIVGV